MAAGWSMQPESNDPKDLGFYFSLSQVGMEMVAPVAVGAVLDHKLAWAPWGTIVGALLGLGLGMTHLIVLLSGRNRRQPPQRRQDSP